MLAQQLQSLQLVLGVPAVGDLHQLVSNSRPGRRHVQRNARTVFPQEGCTCQRYRRSLQRTFTLALYSSGKQISVDYVLKLALVELCAKRMLQFRSVGSGYQPVLKGLGHFVRIVVRHGVVI